MNIVIVDDAQVNITLMEALVRKIGDYRPNSFTDSALALDWCKHNDPDLIILDYMMPAPDGLEFLDHLRATEGKEDVPVLMVTADHEREVRYQALQRGATDFLTKPVDRIEFHSRVRNMLAIRRNHLLVADRATTLAHEIKRATDEIYARERETIVRLAKAAEFRDPETGAHVQRMAHFSRLIAEALGWSPEQCDMILNAAPMHDVGKLGTPDHILLKAGKLTPDEFAIMQQHASIGWEILKESASPILQMAAEIARSHHEKYDGTGYPRGLKGEDIPEVGRIVAVADVFDALTSERPYKKAWPVEAAVDYLTQNRGKHFDPRCVDAFMNKWEDVLAVRERYRDTQEDGKY